MKRTFILTGAFVLLAGIAKTEAQTIPQNIFNATGGTKLLGTEQWDWSIGEVALVNTFYGSNIIVTQGFLQNELSTPQRVNNTELANRLQIFPNPASSLITLQYTASTDGKLNYRLMDMTGKVVIDRSSPVKQGLMTDQLNVSNLAAATYMLEVMFTDSKDVTSVTSYKIEKLN